MYDNSPERIGYVKGLVCLECKEIFTLKELIKDRNTIYTNVGPCFDGPLDVKYDLDSIKKVLTPKTVRERFETNATYFMLKELLPIDTIKVRDAPFTPLIKAKNLENFIKSNYNTELKIYLKLDTENETGSFKDRPTRMAFNKALEDGSYRSVVTSSTGNLAIATLNLARDNDFGCIMFVPNSLGEKKHRAMRNYCSALEYGFIPEADWKDADVRKWLIETYIKERLSAKNRRLVRFDGVYDDANRFAHEVAEGLNERAVNLIGKRRCFIPNDTHRPYYKEGSKTSGFEIALQLLYDFNVTADEIKIIYPIGSGALGCSAIKGIDELKELGIVKSYYRLYATQGEGCSPVVDAILAGEDRPRPMRAKDVKTIAKSIAIYNPGSGSQLIDVVRATKGNAIKVPEKAIFESTLLLYEEEGIFSQFVGGLSIAAILKGIETRDFIDGDIIVANVTGTGRNRIEDELESFGKEFGLEQRANRVLRFIE